MWSAGKGELYIISCVQFSIMKHTDQLTTENDKRRW